MKKQIIIILSIVIILLAAVVVDILFFKNLESIVSEDKEILEEEFIVPSNEELLNWKTYNSEKFSFEIKYPIGWTRAFSSTEFSESLAFSSPPESIYIGEELIISPKVMIAIVSSENTGNLDLELVVKDIKERFQILEYELISEKQVLFKDITAKKIVFSNEEINIFYYILIENNNIYIISSEVFRGQDESINLFNKVFSTFIF